MDEAESLFNQYLVLKENSNGDMTQLQEGKTTVRKG